MFLYREVGAALIQWLNEKWSEMMPASRPVSLEKTEAFKKCTDLQVSSVFPLDG
jgi:hypothetical protein